MLEEAVAIKYHPKYPAPMILAKGRGRRAEKIKELADKHKVPILEDEYLAKGLLKLPEGTFIPEEFFPIMANILAVVFQSQDRLKENQ